MFGLFGLLILIAIYAILGFMLAWIVGIIAKEEITVGQGVIILILAGIVSIALGIGLGFVVDPETANPLALAGMSAVFNLCTIAVFTKLIAQIGWKESFIISAIYAALIFLIGLILPF